VAKASDLVMMVLDSSKAEEQKVKLVNELEKVGLRLNKRKPNITIVVNKQGGVHLMSSKKLLYLDEKHVRNILSEYKIHNAAVHVMDEDVTDDDLIDTIEGNRKYVQCIYVYNKIDQISME